MSPKKSLGLSPQPGIAPQSPTDARPDGRESRNGTEGEAQLSVAHSTAKEDTKSEGKTKRITFEVSEKQHQAIKIRAIHKGMTLKELMQSLLDKELEAEGL